ncbi:unnamed protein product, partial [Dibothriocephalus latus]
MSSRPLLALLISLHLSLAYAAVLYPWTYADFIDTRGLGGENEAGPLEEQADAEEEQQRPGLAKRPFYNPWANYHALISRLKSARS